MPRISIPDFNSPVGGPAFEIRAPRSAIVVILAGLAILAMAAIGFYRGLVSTQPSMAVGPAGLTSAVVGAKPATPMAQNPAWSVLNGPQMSSAAPAKAPADDDADDSDAPDDDQPAAANAPPPASAQPATPATAPKSAPTTANPTATADPPPF